MKKRLNSVFFSLVIISLLLLSPTWVNAQSGWAVRINTITTLETPNALSLKAYFNIFDQSTGAAVTNADIAGAQVTLLNTGYVANGQIQQPDIPIYIALVLDSSGSMAGSAELLKNAAKQALNNIPNNAFFSVIQFDEEIKLLQDFTENLPAVNYAIDQLQVSNRGTCLYDAAYTAVEAMEKAPAGRRAVILFTDGKDETREGTVCSQHTYQELVNLAMKTQVPIHTIGLSVKANINTVELEGMAASTGGFSAVVGESNLGKAFEQIMAGLKAQWMVAAEVYPRQGENNAVLTLEMADNSTLTADFVFNSSKEYPGPPSPVTAQLDGLYLRPENMTFDVQLSLTSPELVNYVKLSLWDQKAGSKVGDFMFEGPAAHNTFNIPTDQLTAGRDYELRIIATSKSDNVPFEIFRAEDGKTSTELVHTFNFDPSGFMPQLTIQSIVQSGNDLSLNVATTNANMVVGYDGWLVDEDTNTVVPNSNFSSASLQGGSGSILLPLEANKIPDGKYTIVVRALGDNQQVFSSQEYNGIVYTAVRPNIFQRVFTALTLSPIYFFIIIGIIVLVVAFLMILSFREKSLSGTPVMQGRLGGGLSKKDKSASNLPLASEEPIPPAQSKPAQPVRNQPAAVVTPPSQVVKPVQAPEASPIQADKTISGAPANLGAEATFIAPRAVSACLRIIRAPAGIGVVNQKIPLKQFPFTIGRQNTVWVVNEASVSRLHAEIRFEPQRSVYSLTDLGSSNGTRLNGVPLTPRQPVEMAFGSRIQFGPNVEMVFEQE